MSNVLGTIYIAGKDYTLDDLTLGEIEEFETAMGTTMAAVDLTSAKALVHLVYLVMRRENPEYTMDDARQIKLVEVMRPTEGGDAPLAESVVDEAPVPVSA